MAFLDRALDALDALARWIAMVCATAIIAILAAQIVFRYALNSSIIWSEEVATWRRCGWCSSAPPRSCGAGTMSRFRC